MSETQRNQVGALNTIAVEQLYRVRSILLGSELVRPQNGWKDVALCQDILETLGNLLDGGSHPGTTTRRSIPFETARDDLKGMGDDIYVALNDLVFYAEEMQGMKEQMALVEGGLREWICQLEREKRMLQEELGEKERLLRCRICFEEMEDKGVLLPCMHGFYWEDCWEREKRRQEVGVNWQKGKYVCPYCRGLVKEWKKMITG